MTTEFSKSVDIGLRLSKRIYYGKDGPCMSAPKPAIMTKSPSPSQSSCSSTLPAKHHPTAPMVYAMITEPDIVDNPDIRSYQPHVYGRCNPPAMIPLHMHGISMIMDCYLDTAFVTVTGSWRVHCVTASACCDCRIAIPMGEQGSILDIKIESSKRSYFTKLIAPGDEKDSNRITKAKNGFLMKRNTYTLRIPQVDGGSIIHAKVIWCQKLLYQDNEFHLSIPFSFPQYVLPLENKIPQIEKLVVNVNPGTGTVITCSSTSHPLKEVQRQPGEASFSYEAEVCKWSTQDFYFAYSVCSNEIFGGLLLQSPLLHDYDRRDMFYFYLFPGTNIIRKHFRKEVVFLLDISGSMRGVPFEKSKHAIITSLLKLNRPDLFNIIAFNEGIQTFSSSLELVTEETIRNATQWMWKRLVAEGDTNLMCPLKQAIEMVGKNGEFIPLIFLITDGTVEDERDICNMMKSCLVDGGLSSPRIFTFGIGSYCNHHFLSMLAHIGRGYHACAYDLDLIGDRMQRLFNNALSPLLANVTLDSLETLKSYELYPSRIPDLLSGSPLIVSGRYQGKFPELVKVRGLMADLSSYVMDIKVRKSSNNINLDRICGMREVYILTSQAWLDQNTDMEKKVAKMSLQTGVPSEYTRIVLVQKDKIKPTTLQSLLLDEKCSKLSNQKMIYMRNPCVGFGNLKATAVNLPPGIEDMKSNEAAKMVMEAATSCWGTLVNSWCWRCVIERLSQLKNEQCTLTLTQLCTVLACFECLDWCCELCDSCINP